jgi:hypothetical protein
VADLEVKRSSFHSAGWERVYVEAGDTSSRGKYLAACSASAFDAITACDERGETGCRMSTWTACIAEQRCVG